MSSFPFLTTLMASWGVVLCAGNQGAACRELCLGCESAGGCARCGGTRCCSGADATEQLLLLRQTAAANGSCVRVQSRAQRSTPASAGAGRGVGLAEAWGWPRRGAAWPGPPGAFRGRVRARLAGRHEGRRIRGCEAMLPVKHALAQRCGRRRFRFSEEVAKERPSKALTVQDWTADTSVTWL